MSERTDRIRAAQEGISHSSAMEAATSLFEFIAAHEAHPWHTVGRCVYCGPCRVRLYQGTIPKDHPLWTPPRRRTPADEMRERWGKDR